MRRTRAPTGQRGQATVEFALIIPMVVLATLAVVQVAVVAYAQLEAVHVAQRAARVLAADPSADLTTLDGVDGYSFIVTTSEGSSARPTVQVIARREIMPVTSILERVLDRWVVEGEARVMLE